MVTGRLDLPGPIARAQRPNGARERRAVRLAVPDGHQQRHAVDALSAAGLVFRGYGDGETVRRPRSGIDGLEVKVIRPQDMAQLVALGEFDLAITGRDCLNEHLYAFPSSPVEEVVDLARGQYNLSAVVSEDLPAKTLDEAVAIWRAEGKDRVTIAAEFPATADYYARLRHFWRYRVIPIAGASEGFVPEDADMLIEGTETGRTIAENRLKVIDNIYRSTTCVIGHKARLTDGERKRVRDDLVGRLRRSVES
jgi:ATP phosphoribosyltransferase